MGSGSDGLGQAEACEAVVRLSGKPRPRVLYLGTASYDLPGPLARQTARFAEAGCPVSPLLLAGAEPAPADVRRAFEGADVVVASGGNTLFALGRWSLLGIGAHLRRAMERGAVLAGGSAGAICWFDAGHSDSMDPASYRDAMLRKADEGGDESSQAPTSAREAQPWEYIRVPCLGFLPGLCCPHHDRVQSNGVARSQDFDAMLKRHPGETGLGIDHWAALVVEGERFSVLSLEGRDGPVDGGGSAEGRGRPGVWRKRVVGGAVRAEAAASSGLLRELLSPAAYVTEDPRVAEARRANPAAHAGGAGGR